MPEKSPVRVKPLGEYTTEAISIAPATTDEDKPHVTFDIEKAREELRRLVEGKDE
jgi:hypothetical protein